MRKDISQVHLKTLNRSSLSAGLVIKRMRMTSLGYAFLLRWDRGIVLVRGELRPFETNRTLEVDGIQVRYGVYEAHPREDILEVSSFHIEVTGEGLTDNRFDLELCDESRNWIDHKAYALKLGKGHLWVKVKDGKKWYSKADTI